ncbi:oxygen-sensing cyclic-di-GMP phosphodiesterase [Novacetimonas maltaceti]|uniref:Oxygen sensor protein DosP n=1 Tax=Novacetimonas maltaceti TaxID=1203393 RepID=A0A2S3W0Q9_9PROT|nr:oxygen-sensing cyclic-di-GMP phosphodiesterase DosP [Novacetimonas maltaceti]POF62442.1 Oxygen sensor protein DosP [Novacetimonas maltaceti]PYD60708.1 oxygen-sensing cyclic-di-GMP phosphodiesterase [Novacetimonas maltaceti]
MPRDTLDDTQVTVLPALEQTILGVVLIDETNTVTFFNSAAERLWNCTRADVLGRNVNVLVPRKIRSSHDDLIKHNRDTGINKIVGTSREVQVERFDGTSFWAELSLSRISVSGKIGYMALIRDISQEVADREKIRLLSLVVRETDRGVVILDPEFRLIYVNRAFTDMFGYEPSHVIGHGLSVILAGDTTDISTLNQLHSGAQNDKGFNLDIRARHKNGRDIWVSATMNPVFEDHGDIENIVVVLTDITENHFLETLQRDALEAISSDLSLREIMDFICRRIENNGLDVMPAIFTVDNNSKLKCVGRASLPLSLVELFDSLEIGPDVGSSGVAAYTGKSITSPDIEIDPKWLTLRSAAMRNGIRAAWATPIVLRGGRVAGVFTLYFRTKRQPQAWCQKAVNASLHLCTLALERYEAKEHIAKLSHFDTLTGLPNRLWLRQHLDKMLRRPTRGNFMLLSLGLDNFKNINDVFGHAAGDDLISYIATQLRDAIGIDDTIVRSGGDQFTIITSGIQQHASSLSDMILRLLSQPMQVGDVSVTFSASIGISVYPENGETGEMLLKHAETAMFQAKAHGGGNYCFFSPKMNQQATDRLILAAALRDAIAHDRLRLVYQPQVHARTGRMYGVEALSRWNDPTLGFISPARFIAVAEETGQIEAIGKWSMRAACRQMAEWIRNGIDIPTVSVNLSPLHFRDEKLPEFVAEVLEETGIPPARLMVEITESTMIDNYDRTIKAAQALRELGVGMSMDDFGTGFSSLSNLAGLPVNEVKIDRSFMNGLETVDKVRSVVTAVIRIGQSLGMTVVAEGVEHEEQRQILVNMDCDVLQGYMFSKPLASEDLITWLANYTPKEVAPA